MSWLACWLTLGMQPAVYVPAAAPALTALLASAAAPAWTVAEVAEAALADRLTAERAAPRAALLLGYGLEALQALQARGLLAGAPQPAFGLPYAMIGAGAGAAATPAWDELPFVSHEPVWLLPTADAEPGLYLSWIAGWLARGKDEAFAFTWLRTLDARVIRYVESDALVRQGVAQGEGQRGIVRSRVPAAPGAPVAPLGWAAVATVAPWPELERMLAVVAAPEFRAKAAAAFGALPLSAWPDAAEQVRWLQRWRDDVRGQGHRAAVIEDWLDTILALAFVVFLVVAWRRLARSEAGGPHATA